MKTSSSNTGIVSILTIVSCFIIVLSSGSLFASDLSDARQLREKCEAEIKVLEIAVKNFGNDTVQKHFQDGSGLMKSGKIKFAQSKYLEAIADYNKYLKLHHEMYKLLAADYINRTESMYNDTAAELVDFVDKEKIQQYFKLASQNLADAKKAVLIENYKLAVETCRNSKRYSIESYKIAGKPVPEKFKKDVQDINKEMAKLFY